MCGRSDGLTDHGVCATRGCVTRGVTDQRVCDQPVFQPAIRGALQHARLVALGLQLSALVDQQCNRLGELGVGKVLLWRGGALWGKVLRWGKKFSCVWGAS